MKIYEWVIAIILIGIGVMSMAVCGAFYKMTEIGYWLTFFKTLVELSLWIGIPIALFYLISFIYRKYKK